MHSTVTFRDGDAWPALGIGTWQLGEGRADRAAEVGVLRLAFELGVRVVDTAEMYGDGGAEEVLGQAIAEATRAGLSRDELRIVSKVYPHHADERGVVQACQRSLRRLGLDHLDLYLLHWRGTVPLARTVRGFETLVERGLVRRWGVSNFDVGDLRELDAVPGGGGCAANQVYYSLSARGIEHDLLPLQQRRGLPLMAYSPIDQGALAGHPALQAVAARHGASAARVALAWVLAQPGVLAIPKAATAAHLRDDLAAVTLRLTPQDRADLDAAFPPPGRRTPLAMR